MSLAATPGRFLAAALALAFLAATAHARDKVKVTGAAVGFPVAGGDARTAKFGAWAPVFISFEVTGDATGSAEVLIEVPDPDEIVTAFAVPVDLGSDRTAVGYVRPNGVTTDVTVSVRLKGGAALSEPFRVQVRPREPLQYTVLALGGAPSGFELPRPAGSADAGPLRGGRVELAHVANVEQLPDRWYGYDGVDLVLLNTGTAADLVKAVFGPDASPANVRKREALVEWARRGGRIVTSLGANAPLAAELPALEPLLPFGPTPGAASREVEVFGLVWPVGAVGGSNTVSGALGGRGTKFAVANLTPRDGRQARVISPPPRAGEDRPPVMGQGALGLGRVTVVGFDLDGPQLAEFAARADFWDFLLREGGAARASGGDGKPRPPGVLTEDEDEAAVAVRVHDDTFDGVPVVSFGWVAVLIVLYILFVGPVEYYVLKRVLGRLELTWVTFPVIVLTVSALAYYSAYTVKGRDLKVNKLDVVDIDPASNRVYGSTWCTVFSPRIDAYSVGVTPNGGWAADPSPTGTAVAAVGAPRAGRPGLTRRRYEYTPEGLDGVPIQVWSTKAFAANWSADLEEGTGRPKVKSELYHPPGDRTKVLGTFRHELPVPELTDCVAFYAGQAYPLPGELIVRGSTVRLVLGQGEGAQQWLQSNAKLDALLGRVQSYAERPNPKGGARQAGAPAAAGPLPLWGLLFHEGALRNDEGVVARNASVRRLDQSWRLSDLNRDEVIVVGRAAVPVGPAEDVLSGPGSPSKLWLKGLPGAGDRRPLPGTGRQETWVRFYLPVK